MLSVVGTIAVAAMLERQAVQTLALGRQAGTARQFHLQRGLREIFQAWVRAQQRQAIRNAVDPDGRAGEMTLPDGTVITMYVFDAQGSVRTEFAGLEKVEIEDTKAVLAELGPMSQERRRELTRDVGPQAVSVFSASFETLTAIVDSVTGGIHTSDIMDQLAAIRDDPQASASALTKSDITQHIDEENQDRFARLLTTEPRLWEVVLDVQFGSDFTEGPRRGRYRGVFLLPPPRATTMYANRVQVLGWEHVDLEGPIQRSR
jgi:hypothetical protein